ncbi:MAG TPA: ubiquinol oxidase subunit II [Candidatus Paceibacterota bacterium]|nr:ubiquinol oxidase subunit II [Candidatus Paceibacterota bacterium]
MLSQLFSYVGPGTFAVLDPRGPVGLDERNLMLTALVLMLGVLIPVFMLTAAIAWRYRAGNTKARYTPNWEHNALDEFIWWAIPCAIIFVLALITWKSTHDLDPYRPLRPGMESMPIQVVALDWKWLFIYPNEGIATVNFVEFPEDTAIDFEITADAPMNSFWIPQLGGQIYAMPAMTTHLNLMASGTGSYFGTSANISGEGFSGMTFTAKSVSEEEFERWVESVRAGTSTLTREAYDALAKPSAYEPVATFSAVEDGLYNTIIGKYLAPPASSSGTARTH